MQHCTGHSSGMSKDDRLRSQATTKCHQVFNILRLHKESLYFQRKGVRGRVTLEIWFTVLNSQNNTELNIQDKNRPLFSFIVFNWFPWFFSDEYQLSLQGYCCNWEHESTFLFFSVCSFLLHLLHISLQGFLFSNFAFSSLGRTCFGRWGRHLVRPAFQLNFFQCASSVIGTLAKNQLFCNLSECFWKLAKCRTHSNKRKYIGTFCDSHWGSVSLLQWHFNWHLIYSPNLDLWRNKISPKLYLHLQHIN